MDLIKRFLTWLLGKDDCFYEGRAHRDNMSNPETKTMKYNKKET